MTICQAPSVYQAWPWAISHLILQWALLSLMRKTEGQRGEITQPGHRGAGFRSMNPPEPVLGTTSIRPSHQALELAGIQPSEHWEAQGLAAGREP